MYPLIPLFNFIFLSLLFGDGVVCRISNKRRCADETCSQPISLATSLLRYSADDERLLSFPQNAKAKIFSKEAGDKPTFWEAEINGKRGYVPKNLFKEMKVLVKHSDVNVIVSTGRDDGNQNLTESKTVDNNSSLTSTVTETPSLSMANSKGLFSMMGGVSADSVPPNSPEISPQTTRKFQVFDGTTVYEDPGSEPFDKPPDIVSGVKQTPPIPKDHPLKQSNIGGSNIKSPLENVLPVSNTLNPDIAKRNEDDVKPDVDKDSVKPDVDKDSVKPGEDKHNKDDEKPDIGKDKKHDQETNKETSKEPAIAENTNGNEMPEFQSNNRQNARHNFAEMKDNIEMLISAGKASENQIPFNHQSNNDVQEEAAEENQDMQKREETKLDDIRNDDQQSENEAGIIGSFVNQVSSFMSSGIGAEEEEAEEGEEEKEEQGDDMYVSVEDSGSGDNEETSVLEESSNEKALPVTNDEKNSSQAKSQPFKIPESASEAPASRDIVKPGIVKPAESSSSIPENSPDKSEEEAIRSGISDSEDEKYLSGENFQEFPSRVENVEESAVVVNNTPVIGVSTSNETDKKQETPEVEEQVVLIAVPVETDTSDVRPVPTEKPTSKKVEQRPMTETTTSKPIDALLPAQPNMNEPSSENESEIGDKTEELSKEYSSTDEPKVANAYETENITSSSDVPEVSSASDGVNITEPVHDVETVEDVMKSHSEPVSQFLPQEEKEKDVKTDQVEQTNEEIVSPENKVHVEFNKPEPDQIPDVPSTPSPLHNILSFQYSSHLPSTHSPVVDDSLVMPAAGEISEEIEDSDNTSSDVKADFTAETQSEEYGDGVKQDPTSDTSQSDQSEDEAKVVEISSNSPEETFPELNQEESAGMFSWLDPLFEMFSSSQLQSQVADQVSTVTNEQSSTSENLDPFHIPKLKEESCLADGLGEEACEALKNVPQEAIQDDKYTSLYTTDISSALELLEKIPLEATVWLIVTAVVVLIFSLGHYYIEAHRRDGPLVAIINKLEREVLILKKESSILDDRLHTAQEQLEAWNTNSSENDALIVELKEELEKIKADKAELEEQVAVLEREVETVTESGLEMHRLLSESLSSQDGSQVLLSTVESLREKLEHQEDEITNLSHSLYQKDLELDDLKDKLGKAKEVSSSLENKVIDIVREKDEEALELKEKHRQLIAQLEGVMETKALDETRASMEMSKLRLAMKELQKSSAEKDAELEEVKEVVKQLRSTDSNEKMDALFDVVGVRAQLKQAATDRDTFREKFQEEEGARKLLEGHMKKITQEVSELKNSYETAEKEKIEALTKLQVLSNYFKEKESQLQKELGLQESMWVHKQSEDHSIYEQMRSLREENEKYKGENTTTVAPPQPKPRLAEVKTKKKNNSKASSVRQTQGLQNESLKKEIVEQEASFKIQVANVEQKAHENWVTSRQAERRLKEVQQEAAQLRNKLTMEKSNYSLDDSKQNISQSETNGDPSSPPPPLIFPPTTSPPFMMYPHMAPPGDFIPPPPLTGSPYPSDSRPPPLGRISSPPLDHRFSPPPPLPYPPYDYSPYGHHSPSPPPPLPPQSHHRNVHKPQPREMSREQKDHSNYSPETDKPMRRKKR